MKMNIHFIMVCLLILALSSPTYENIIYIYIYLRYSAIYEIVLSSTANTCGQRTEIHTKEECFLAVKSIGEYAGIPVGPGWTGAASHVPPGCSTPETLSKLDPHWNTLASASNNGHYKKACNSQ